MGRELNAERILIVAPNWVGDSVFMLPAVSALRRHFSKARFTLLAKPGIIALHEASALFDERVPLIATSRWQRFAAHLALRAHRFDLGILFPPSFSSALALYLTGARQRLGRPGQGRGLFLNRRGPLPAADRQRHVVEEYLDLARLAGAQPLPEDKQLRLPLTQGGAEEQNRLFREQGLSAGPQLIALCPTSAYGPSKCWPVERYAELARLLKAQRYQPYLLGAPHEMGVLSAISGQAQGLPILTLGLPGLAACLAASGVVVANDSGPLHIAAAVGARCVGLYGPVDPRWSAPLSYRSTVLYRAEPCSPCHAAVCPLGHHDCLKKIEAGEAQAAILDLLKR